MVRLGSVWHNKRGAKHMVVSIQKNITVPGSLVTIVREKAFSIKHINDAKLEARYTHLGQAETLEYTNMILAMARRIGEMRVAESMR